MAAKTELESLDARKARLIKENAIHREALLSEADNLRQAADVAERSHNFLRTAISIGILARPFFPFGLGKKRGRPVLLDRCMAGFQIWRKVLESCQTRRL